MKDLIGLFVRVKLLLQTRSVLKIHRLGFLITRGLEMKSQRRQRTWQGDMQARCHNPEEVARHS